MKERAGYLFKWFYIDMTLARVVNLIIELNYEHSKKKSGACRFTMLVSRPFLGGAHSGDNSLLLPPT